MVMYLKNKMHFNKHQLNAYPDAKHWENVNTFFKFKDRQVILPK